jgi:hypothetical protein
VARFNNEGERAAWVFAESMIDKARDLMSKAESSLERFLVGQELNKERCLRRGIGATDAEIRWSETSPARKALSENSFYVSQAMMYYNAAAAYYSRAHYLRSRGSDGPRADGLRSVSPSAPAATRPGPPWPR